MPSPTRIHAIEAEIHRIAAKNFSRLAADKAVFSDMHSVMTEHILKYLVDIVDRSKKRALPVASDRQFSKELAQMMAMASMTALAFTINEDSPSTTAFVESLSTIYDQSLLLSLALEEQANGE